jgi:hypothetical protein
MAQKELLEQLVTESNKIRFYTVSTRLQKNAKSQVLINVPDVRLRVVTGKGTVNVDTRGRLQLQNQRIVLSAKKEGVNLSRFISYQQMLALCTRYPDVFQIPKDLRKPTGDIAKKKN